MDEKIFDRTEKKYLITRSDYNYLIEINKKHMEKDGYYKSTIYNIYFDNDNYDLIIQSIDHPVFKQKLRARSYKGYDKVFFEIKTKLNRDILEDSDENLGYKRRILITKNDYKDYIKGRASFINVAMRDTEQKTDLQIAKEIDYMIKHFDLKPKILVMYDRESYRGDDDLRITFDTHLKYRTTNLKFTKNSADKPYFEDKKCIIMEIKAKGYLPLWLVYALSKKHIYPQRFSKIGKIYLKIRKEQKDVQ